MDESSSMISTSTRMFRADGEQIFRQKPVFYLWFFGQIHAKKLLVFLFCILTIVALTALTYTTDPFFSTIPVPGLDGKSLFGVSKHRPSQSEERISKDSSPPRVSVTGQDDILTINSEPAQFRRNFVSLLAYFYLFSVVFGILSLRYAERVWICLPLHKCSCLNPAVLLFPFLLSMISFAVPLFIWTLRSVRNFYIVQCGGPGRSEICNSFSFIWEMLFFIALPILFIWMSYAYMVFGCVLGFVYIHRRSSAGWRSKEQAAASFSWSFRDKASSLDHSYDRSGQVFLPNFGLNGGRGSVSKHASYRSSKSARPSLRAFRSTGELTEAKSGDIPESGSGDNEAPSNIVSSIVFNRTLDVVPEEAELSDESRTHSC